MDLKFLFFIQYEQFLVCGVFDVYMYMLLSLIVLGIYQCFIHVKPAVCETEELN